MTPRTWSPAPCPLPTRWSSGVDPENTHPEHPRPQLVRSHWCSLNGLWDFAKTPIERSFPDAFPESILVPFPVESSLSGIGRTVTARDRLWYRRRLQVDHAPPGYTWLLHFGAVDWRADGSLDGRHLGTYEGGFDPFCLEVGQLGGEHELVVAVWDPTDDGPQPRGKQARHPPLWARPFFYTPASGIWQTVWLELVPTTRIDRLHLTAKGDALWFAARLSGASGGEYLSAVVRAEGEEITRGAGAATGFAIPIPNPRRWSPRDPFLYGLELELRRADRTVDAASSYFGLRAITMQRDTNSVQRILLNGEPIFLHGLLDQGYWPDGIYTAPGDEALRFDLEQTKRLGFNLVRKHVKVEPARWYWHCDRRGLLVMQDMPSGDRMTLGLPIGNLGGVEPNRWLGRRGIRRTAESKRIFERELERMIEHLSSHPSIFCWVVFNEGWGQYDPERIAARVKELDPTRLVDAASGWVDSGTGDLRDVHVYYPGPRIPSRPDPERADVLGEWGGLGLEITGHRWPKRPFAYRTFPDPEALTAGYAPGIQRLRELRARPDNRRLHTNHRRRRRD